MNYFAFIEKSHLRKDLKALIIGEAFATDTTCETSIDLDLRLSVKANRNYLLIQKVIILFYNLRIPINIYFQEKKCLI